MEIAIGISHTSREVNIESQESADAIYEKVAHSIETGAPLRLEDSKDREVIVPAASIAYVELANSKQRHVGFGL